jgi:hypothetical protein
MHVLAMVRQSRRRGYQDATRILREGRPAMSREEMLEMRKEAIKHLEEMRRAGDYGAGAAWARATAERQLKLIDHLLEKLR